MVSNSEAEFVEEIEQSNTVGSRKQRKPRKKRIRLSCIECRNKKLSCDRNLPCQRCIRTGRSRQCSFETVAESLPTPNPAQEHQEQQIRDLRAEITELKALVSEVRSTRESDGGGGNSLDDSHTIDTVDHLESESGQPIILEEDIFNAETLGGINDIQLQSGVIFPDDSPIQNPVYVNNKELSDPIERSPRVYYGQHTLFQFFGEIRELFPFIKETAEDWFKPLGVNFIKDKSTRVDDGAKPPSRQDATLEGLLPPKEDTDALVSFYLDHAEQLHRVVHVPTFKKEYGDFWIPGRPRYPAMVALILAIISISNYAFSDSANDPTIPIRYRAMPAQWISACEDWLNHQSPKHRKLVHYQIVCLVYLAKRLHMVGKKRWWKDTSSLIQDAILDGLHCDPSSKGDTPYTGEMKRRIWNVLRELDLQNSFESGLPSFLHNIDSDVAPPANLDDEDFSETSEEIHAQKSLSKYTSSSYQIYSARSWSLRLEISQRLFSTRFSKPLSYDDILSYTNKITQEIEAIPSWDTNEQTGPKSPSLARAFLVFQLKECILALHRPYLQKKNGGFWLSETVCYHTSRDILLMNSRLAQLGLQGLTALRSDLLLASLTLVRITMLQTKVLTSMIMSDSQSTIDLLEQCLPFMEDMYLRCSHGEPWCFITMCGAIMVLKIHLGKETRQTAKADCARRFLHLHDKYNERRRMIASDEWFPMPANPVESATCRSVIPTTDFAASGWLDDNYLELGTDFFDIDINMDGGTWNS